MNRNNPQCSADNPLFSERKLKLGTFGTNINNALAFTTIEERFQREIAEKGLLVTSRFDSSLEADPGIVALDH